MNTNYKNSDRLGSTTFGQARQASVQLALDLAIRANDPKAVSKTIVAELAPRDVESAGYVAVAALECLTKNILWPLMETLEEIGADPRKTLSNVREQLLEAQNND